MKGCFRFEPVSQHEITVAPGSNGGVSISTTDEHAMDSYNEFFTNCIDLPLEQVILLRDWLSEHIANPPAPEAPSS